MFLKYLYLLMLCLFFLIVSSQANKQSQLVFLGGRKRFRIVNIFILLLGALMAFRPLDISDAGAYYNRYYIEPAYTTIKDILNNPSFYRGTGYSMSKAVNLLFYISYNFHISFQLFVMIIVILEIVIYKKYSKKIIDELRIEYNECLLFAMVLLFYSFRYQFIAFAQGIAMCLAAPILYFLMKKKYWKVMLFIMLACCIHISALFFLVIVAIYIFTVRMKTRTYVALWLISGFLIFSGLGYKFGDGLTQIAQFVINGIVSSNPIYEAYSAGEGGFIMGISSFLFWVLCGLFVMVYSDYDEYWKLINVNLISLLICAVFGRWEVVHRFTDISKMYVPIVMVIYVYNAKPAITIPNLDNKRITFLAVLVLGFAHNLSLLGFI